MTAPIAKNPARRSGRDFFARAPCVGGGGCVKLKRSKNEGEEVSVLDDQKDCRAAQAMAARIRALLRADVPVYGYETLDSTSEECRRRIAAGQTACLVLAEEQTAGRGRCGRSFFSPPGSGLYMSLAFPREGFDPAALTTYAAVCAAEAIEGLTGVSCGVKWVNDLYLRGKKVGGILTEAVGGTVIIGVGVNLQPSAVPPELRDTVGTLGCGDVRAELAAAVADGLLAWPGDFSHLDAYRRRSILSGRMVSFPRGGVELNGSVAGIADDGALLVRTAEGTLALRSGEVRLTHIEGLR